MSRLSRDEMVALVDLLLTGAGDEREVSGWLEALERSIPNPHISDLIFHPEQELTAAEIVDRALEYGPFAL